MRQKSERAKMRLKKCCANTRGTSMIEVLVAFVLVLLMTAAFSKVVAVSVRMLSNSLKIIKETESFNEQYYTNQAYSDRKDVEGKLKLVLNKTETDSKNYNFPENSTKIEAEIALNTDGKVVYWIDDGEDGVSSVNGTDGTGYKMFSVKNAAYASTATEEPTATEMPTAEPTTTFEPREEGWIIVGGDNIIDFSVSTFDYIQAQKDAVATNIATENYNGSDVNIPAGVYEEDGKYYLITEDISLKVWNKYDGIYTMAEINTSEFYNRCIILDLSSLYTEADINYACDNYQCWLREAPDYGSIFRVDSEYYVDVLSNPSDYPYYMSNASWNISNNGWKIITSLIGIDNSGLPEKSTEIKEGSGKIVINPSETNPSISFQVSTIDSYVDTYTQLCTLTEGYTEDEKWKPRVFLNKGVYQIGENYYLVTKDMDLNYYQMYNPPVTSGVLKDNSGIEVQMSGWIYKINTSTLYTESDYIENSNFLWKDGRRPGVGDILLYKDRYYFCLFEQCNSKSNAQIAPNLSYKLWSDEYSGSVAWMDITDWVTTVSE